MGQQSQALLLRGHQNGGLFIACTAAALALVLGAHVVAATEAVVHVQIGKSLQCLTAPPLLPHSPVLANPCPGHQN